MNQNSTKLSCMQITLTVIYILKSENDVRMTDFTTCLRIANMTYSVVVIVVVADIFILLSLDRR